MSAASDRHELNVRRESDLAKDELMQRVDGLLAVFARGTADVSNAQVEARLYHGLAMNFMAALVSDDISNLERLLDEYIRDYA
jgi:hypothetical protein